MAWIVGLAHGAGLSGRETFAPVVRLVLVHIPANLKLEPSDMHHVLWIPVVALHVRAIQPLTVRKEMADLVSERQWHVVERTARRLHRSRVALAA